MTHLPVSCVRISLTLNLSKGWLHEEIVLHLSSHLLAKFMKDWDMKIIAFSRSKLRHCVLFFFLLLQVVVHKSSPRGIHFRRAGPRQRVSSLSIPLST